MMEENMLNPKQQSPALSDQTSQPAAVNTIVREPAPPAKAPVPTRDRALAVALLVLGYLFCRFPVDSYSYPLLGLVYGAALFGLTLWHFRFRPGKRALGLWSVGLLFLLSHLLTDSAPVRFFARCFAYVFWAYGTFVAAGNSQETRLGDLFVPESFKAAVLLPFSRLGAFFSTAFSGGKKGWLKTALLILLGLGLAMVPLLLVVLLLRYDDAFSQLLDRIFSRSLPEEVFDRLLRLIGAVILATLLCSLIWGARERRLGRVLTREWVEAFRIRRRFMPLAVSGAMLLPLLAVYGLFFFSQWPIYTSAFTGVLPQGYTYANYAREGFFQLCAVCLINSCLYLFVSLFSRREKGAAFARGLLVALCLCSLVLAATAFSKMALYIRAYGLTPLRVYSSWAMILLTGAFLLALVSTYWKKLNLTRALFLLFTLMFGFLCLADTNAIIADYNVSAYQQGRLDSVDTDVFWELGDSAAPAAVRLVDDPKYGKEVQQFLSAHGKRTFFKALSHGLPGLRARAICQPYWRDPAVVHVRIETEDDFEALSCWFGEKGYEYCGGMCTNGDSTPFARGQKTFFELEPPTYDDMDGWGPMKSEDEVCFRLFIQKGDGEEVNTNLLECAYGEEVHVTLTGSWEKGYTIARTN